MYSVNGKTFDSFMAACKHGQSVNMEVIQVDNGAVRWTPPAVCPKFAKRMRKYEEAMKQEYYIPADQQPKRKKRTKA
jgi:hypothetical protein